ncbi:caspase domain-containing protein [Streptomyces sp. NPDC090045]|uniref:caspase family protein n=1 Tax=Streptomyces sp. NPDC090045 TaxID=3365927 RepID=UPI00381D7EA9
MTLRAVLIGAQTFGLSGVHSDVRLMERVLHDRGFRDVRTRTDDGARYHSLVETLDGLERDTEQEDGVVLYYSGHGAMHERPDAAEQARARRSPYLHYFVPTDVDDSSSGEFRGLLVEELTATVRRLTAITPNVTVILDCCHAGGAVRDPRVAVRAVSRDVPLDAALARADRLSRELSAPDPFVVRLTACQRHEQAYEAPSLYRPGERNGLFTEELARLLQATREHPVPWGALMAQVQDRVMQRVRQRPDLGGPHAALLPFSSETAEHARQLPLLQRGRRLVVPGGAVLGLAQDDIVGLVVPGTAPAEAPQVKVTAIRGADAELESPPELSKPQEFDSPEAGVPGLRAIPVRTAVRRYLAFDGDGPLSRALRAALPSSVGLAVAGPVAPPFATVRTSEDTVVVVDRAGLAFRPPVPDDPGRCGHLLALLEELARGERLRALPDAAGAAHLDAEVEAVFERRRHGGPPQPLRSGDRLADGDEYHVQVVNHAPERLFVWLLDVGLSGRTAMVTDYEPSGCLLAPARSARRPEPGIWNSGWIDIYWPSDVPYQGPRPETLTLLIGNRETDLSSLASQPRSLPAGLEGVAAEVLSGVRDSGRLSDGFRYTVLRCDTEVEPRHPRG